MVAVVVSTSCDGGGVAGVVICGAHSLELCWLRSWYPSQQEAALGLGVVAVVAIGIGKFRECHRVGSSKAVAEGA